MLINTPIKTFKIELILIQKITLFYHLIALFYIHLFKIKLLKRVNKQVDWDKDLDKFFIFEFWQTKIK